jgi:hypothetical protein
MHKLTAFLIAAAMAGLAAAPLVASQQAQPPTLPPAVIPAEEAAAIAQYWVALAEGRGREAGAAASQLLGRYPRNVAVLDLAVEIEIARAGASAALGTYEAWLAGRPVEEPGVLRRVARSFLYEWSRQVTNGEARGEALNALAEDGDSAALSVLRAIAQSNSEDGLRTAVHLRNPQAIGQVIERMRATRGLKVRDLELLGDSGSPLAASALIEALKDPRPENRDAAARALGAIGGPAAEQALLPVLDDPHGVVRTSAAAALFKLGNYTGINILTALATSDSASVRRTAAMFMESRPDEAWKALVRGLLADPDPLIRLDAARMLSPYDPAASRSVLEQLAMDSNRAIREETELAIARLPVATFADLRGVMRTGQPVARVRAAGRVLEMTR